MARPVKKSAKSTRIKPASLLILNGPNLNLLGTRAPEIYGSATLDDIADLCRTTAAELGAAVEFRQSNAEGTLIDWVQKARVQGHEAIIINPAGYSHTSIALMDALDACGLPVFEVHLSNIHRREPFRHMSYVSKIAVGVICGLGATGYELALRAAIAHLRSRARSAVGARMGRK